MKRRIPPTRFPDAVTVSYQRKLLQMVKELGQVTLRQFDATMQTQIKSYQADAGELTALQQMLELIKALSFNIFSNERLVDVANTFVSGLNLFNMKNMNDQAAVAGMNPIDAEPWLADFIESSVKQNVDYIKSIEQTFHDKVSAVVIEGTKKGQATKEIRDQLVHQVSVSESKAQFLAVDQSGSIHGQLVAKRHQNMGVKKFEWLTSQDERVRESHKQLAGFVFDYDRPPAVGLPGEDYRCRCVAIPVFD